MICMKKYLILIPFYPAIWFAVFLIFPTNYLVATLSSFIVSYFFVGWIFSSPAKIG